MALTSTISYTFILLSISLTAVKPSISLETQVNADTTTYIPAGNMFDIRNIGSTDLIINAFSVDVDADPLDDWEVIIYRKSGSFLGYTSSSSVWSVIHQESLTGGSGRGQLTPLSNLQTVVYVFPGQRQAFFIYISIVHIVYGGQGTSEGALLASDSNLAIYEGNAIQGFGQPAATPRLWHGIIYYSMSTTTKSPTSKSPTSKSPTSKSPTSKAPTTLQPTTDIPTTSKAPTSRAPTSKSPTTATPTTHQPTVNAPTTTLPTIPVPITNKPTTAATTTIYTNCEDEKSVILSISFNYTLPNNVISTEQIRNMLSNITDLFIQNEINKLAECNVLHSKVNIELNSNLKYVTINESICFHCNDDEILIIQFSEIRLEKDFIETVQKSQNTSNPILIIDVESTDINIQIMDSHNGKVNDDTTTTKSQTISNNDARKANYSPLTIVIVGVVILSLLCCMFVGFMYIRNRRTNNEMRRKKIEEQVANISMVSIPHTTTSNNASYGSDNITSGNLQIGTDGIDDIDPDDDIDDMYKEVHAPSVMTPGMGPITIGEDVVDRLDANMTIEGDDEELYIAPIVTDDGDEYNNKTPNGIRNEDGITTRYETETDYIDEIGRV